MIYRLKAPTRQDIEEQIPFDLYIKNEQGNDVLVPATEDYSYVYRGHEVIEEAEYDSDGNMTKEPVLSDYVLAYLNVYTDQEITFTSPVERIFPTKPKHGWGKIDKNSSPDIDPDTGKIQSVSRWRLMIVLDEIGILDQVNQAVQQAPKSVQIAWNNADKITRSGQGIAMIQDKMGVSADKIDKMFKQASEIQL